ncbi:unnamed protein product [Pedinophyceae sp. YPF-701]|nr:unnamed protein product [Pedinophyceae sp. YPF-701]
MRSCRAALRRLSAFLETTAAENRHKSASGKAPAALSEHHPTAPALSPCVGRRIKSYRVLDAWYRRGYGTARDRSSGRSRSRNGARGRTCTNRRPSDSSAAPRGRSPRGPLGRSPAASSAREPADKQRHGVADVRKGQPRLGRMRRAPSTPPSGWPGAAAGPEDWLAGAGEAEDEEPEWKTQAAATAPRPTQRRSRREAEAAAAASRPPTELPEGWPSFEELDAEDRRRPELSQRETEWLVQSGRQLAAKGWARDQAIALYVSSALFVRATQGFTAWLAETGTAKMAADLAAMPSRRSRVKVLFPLFARYVVSRHQAEIAAYRELVLTADMTKPHLWYPSARAILRRITYHAGPTNSGKTHQALEALAGAESGVFLAPLRLLAAEGRDALVRRGVRCGLLTGEEVEDVEGSTHLSCTVEMAPTDRMFDVAVIDEIQMIGDGQRGWAWTRALLGVMASEIHVCGDESCLALLQNIAKELDEELTVKKYQRRTELIADDQPLRSLADVQAGDCVVAFSRAAIYKRAAAIQRDARRRVCVVYGALPPDARRFQAKLFSNEGNGWDVLVASDAIGMGLNLPTLRRIIFSTTEKYDAETGEVAPLSVSAVKQIAGRAGCRGTRHEGPGRVTALSHNDLAHIRACLAVPPSDMITPRAGLRPEFEQIEAFASQLPGDTRFSSVLRRFETETAIDGGRYFVCNSETELLLARGLDRIRGLSLSDCYRFSTAPVSLRDDYVVDAFWAFARAYAEGGPVPLAIDLSDPVAMNQGPVGLSRLEAMHKVCSLWMWLRNRFGDDAFPGLVEAEGTLAEVEHRLREGLVRVGGPKTANLSGPGRHPHVANTPRTRTQRNREARRARKAEVGSEG